MITLNVLKNLCRLKPRNFAGSLAHLSNSESGRTSGARARHENSSIPENPVFRQCRHYSDDSQTSSSVRLPPLCDAPLALWPGFFKTIRNLLFVNMVVVPQLDNDFDMPGFVTASKQALYVVSHALMREDYDQLEGLVTNSTVQSLRQKIGTLSDRQKELIAVKQEDIFMTFPHEINVVYDGEKGHERRFLEIMVVHHILHGLARMKESGETPPMDMAERQEFQERMFICNYRFIREYTQGVDSPWIINLINHFTPPGLPW